MYENYQQFWGRYFSVKSPIPITKTNPTISDSDNAFVYKSIFKNLPYYAIYFKNRDSYYILSEQNDFSDGKDTIYITGYSHLVCNHFYSFNNSYNRFIYCENVNSTVTEGSITSYDNSDDGSLYQYNGQINIKAVNFSKCQSNIGSAINCKNIQNEENVSCCHIDSCQALDHATIYYNSLSAKLIKSNIINNTQTNNIYGIIYLWGASFYILDIEDCIFQNNCHNGNGVYVCSGYEAYIYVFRPNYDSDATFIYGRGAIFMSEMDTSHFENDFFICLTPQILIKYYKQKTKAVFDPFSYVHLFYLVMFSKNKK